MATVRRITNSKSTGGCALIVLVKALLTFPGTIHAADAPLPPAPAQTRGGRGVSLDEIFTTLDQNHDGKISKDEATGAFAQRFSQWDGDGDGFATRQEVHNFRQRAGLDDRGQRTASTAPPTKPPAAISAVILKEPADWRMETMAVPPSFAPEVKLKGTEEIRFAPGMFDNTSSTYFTCVIAIVADGVSALGAAEIKDFLEKYYRGLSTSRARRTGVSTDPTQMQAAVQPAPEAENRYAAQVVFFDSFSDGRKITLNVEAVVLPVPAKPQTSMILLVSPSARESEVWPALREIGRKAEENVATTTTPTEAK